MGRRRWRFIAIAALLLATAKHLSCQDENDFYYTPVERSFAQVQPPLFPNNRPAAYYEHTEGFRVPQSRLVNAPQQSLFNDGHTGFPAPNYNQHPSPFQLTASRSQPGSQFYVNQPDFNLSQRQRFRLSLPHNFEFAHSASTRRPDISQIHSIAYQNDPSKPETFLGQITLNNPDTDFLQNSRFKNAPFDGNSLKNVNHHSHGVPIDEDVDDDQDLFEHYRVTTYNPTKMGGRQRFNTKPTFDHISQYEQTLSEQEKHNASLSPTTKKNNLRNKPNITTLTNNIKSSLSSATPQNQKPLYNKYDGKIQLTTSTEYKALHDLEPLLEDDISDLNTFRELMKSGHGSLDVQVIKSGDKDVKQDQDKSDSNPSASSMNMGNVSKEELFQYATVSAELSDEMEINNNSMESNNNSVVNNSKKNVSEPLNSYENHDDDAEDNTEYVEYYDDPETTENTHTTRRLVTTEHSPDIYDEYDTTEESEHSVEELKSNVTNSFDILVMKPNNTMVKDDNFKHFVDTTVIDQLEEITSKEPSEEETDRTELITTEEITTIDTPSILGQEVVSVVTTKSVVNGTISIPDISYASSTTNPEKSNKIISSTITPNKTKNIGSTTDNPLINTTENWIVVASVQTSRSVSGARFLPFPTVEQEETKQILSDVDKENDDDENVTMNPKEENINNSNKQASISSTENINDKLDSIQSELSSAVLEGNLDDNNKNIALLTEPTEKSITTTTIPTTFNVFTLKSTQQPVTTEKSLPEPLPVLIKKFTHRVTTTTTQKPKRKPSFVTVMDDLSGLLPPGYKPRSSYKDKRTRTTASLIASTITTTTVAPILSTEEDDLANGTQARSSGISSKNKVLILDVKSVLVPKDYRPSKETHRQQEDLFKIVKQDDLSKFLPPGYKLPPTEKPLNENKTADILNKIKTVDISLFLPENYKENTSTTEKQSIEPKLLVKVAPVDITAFLPPGFKINETSNNNNDTPNTKFKLADVSNLLPPGFQSNTSEENNSIASTTKAPSNGFKLVFPSRPGSKSTRKTTTPKSNVSIGPNPVTPKIQKGWPIRASTEFTGWPSPSTTPFSIEKLLEAQRNATATSPHPEHITEATTRRTTTTTTTTPLPPPSTTPGVCRHECDLAATIKIVAGVRWVPELLDHHTQEWQNLARDVKEELNSVYSNSESLKKWYKGIRIDAFSKGSVLVDYFIELNELEEKIDTLDLKKLFHKSLTHAKPGSVVETVTKEPNEDFDPDVMLGDQPDEDRMKKSNEKMTKIIDKSAGKLEIGKFVMDPAYTEFIVLPKREEPTIVQPEESFLPQWGIAVIVIALASLLFVVIFGVTVLVNRQKSAKAKQPIPLSEDMLRELDKSHMGGFDDMHQLKERELPYLPSGKRMSTAFIEQLAYPNASAGDSWRSEWTPQLQKYMQHYTPDSGRGSQIYGAAGNLYGYSGSQLYGQTGAGSQGYGYTGEYPRSHHSRRRSEYDSNF